MIAQWVRFKEIKCGIKSRLNESDTNLAFLFYFMDQSKVGLHGKYLWCLNRLKVRAFKPHLVASIIQSRDAIVTFLLLLHLSRLNYVDLCPPPPLCCPGWKVPSELD